MSNLCDGVTHNVAKLRNSKAYCEGRAAAVAGVLIGANPHLANSEAKAAWDKGHNSYGGGVGSALPADCCADTAYDGVP